MAYPSAKTPTLGEFIERAKRDHGCEEHPERVLIVGGPDGSFELVVLLVNHDGKEERIVLPRIGMNEGMSPHVVRSLCARLRISPENFGLVLEDLCPEEKSSVH